MFFSLKRVVLLLLGVFSWECAAEPMPEKEKIDLLIQSIESLRDAQLLRNGTAYDAKTAADHLRMKLGQAGDRIKTAQDFIRYIGSKSSVSGEPYKIRLADGSVIT